MEGTQRIISIAGKDIIVIDKELSQRDLEFYPENPRVFTALRSLEDPNPSQEQIQKIMVEKNKLFKQNILLSRQRDLLLPRLMSGELKVNEIDHSL